MADEVECTPDRFRVLAETYIMGTGISSINAALIRHWIFGEADACRHEFPRLRAGSAARLSGGLRYSGWRLLQKD